MEIILDPEQYTPEIKDNPVYDAMMRKLKIEIGNVKLGALSAVAPSLRSKMEKLLDEEITALTRQNWDSTAQFVDAFISKIPSVFKDLRR